MVNKWLKIVLDGLYPRRCVLCGDPGDDDLDLCAGCRADLPVAEFACPRCARPMNSVIGGAECGACQKNPPLFDSTIAALRYRDPVPWLVQRFKFAGQTGFAELFGALMACRLGQLSGPDTIIPVPLHWRRLHTRGFNQAQLLAHAVGRRLNIPVDTGSTRRVRYTATQSELPAAQRARNLRRAFGCKRHLHDQHVAIVDDVMTTGNTVNEFARTLRSAGAARVDVWVFARAGY